MGNKTSISIELENGGGNSPIVAGGSVTGTVVLSLGKKIHVQQPVVNLRLYGVESTSIHNTIRRRKSERSNKEEQTIARAHTTLEINQNGNNSRVIKRGTYKLPFEFVLPVSLPSSTQFPNINSKTFSGRIQYNLIANIGGQLCTQRSFIVVSAPLPPTVVPCISQPTTTELKQAKILKKGSLTVATCVENTRVGKGEQLQISVACRNSSTVDIERVQVKLVELIEYKAQGENTTLKVPLRSVNDINLPGLDTTRMSREIVHGGNSSSSLLRRSLQSSSRDINIDMGSIHCQLLQDLLSGQNQFTVFVPNSARDTYSGCLIKISHYVKIKFITGSFVDNPSFKLPIVVGTPNPNAARQQRNREPNEPIATVVIDDTDGFNPTGPPAGMSIPSDDSTVEVGSSVIPMAEAIVIDEELAPDQSSTSNSPSSGVSPNPDQSHITIDAGNVFPYNDNEINNVSPRPIPSAPDESLLRQNERMASPNARPSTYAPFEMYNHENDHRQQRNHDWVGGAVSGDSTAAESSYAHEPIRHRFDTFSYTDSVSGTTEATDNRPQLGHAQESYPQQHLSASDRSRMMDQVLRDVRASIHDYEVISGKVRIPQYRQFFSSLTPREFGLIIQSSSMAHQVEIANLLARQLVYASSSFTCAHCAEAINKANNYLRTNMVETLTPMVADFTEKRDLIREQLSAWELTLTEDVFEGLS
mmetsp:Transcript_8482/g.21141  ORF Transcript_8482/g.21141 Transcript_8482/m.21141 type:complete len:702 (+) Transcript_8482:163-2268(+)